MDFDTSDSMQLLAYDLVLTGGDLDIHRLFSFFQNGTFFSFLSRDILFDHMMLQTEEYYIPLLDY